MSSNTFTLGTKSVNRLGYCLLYTSGIQIDGDKAVVNNDGDNAISNGGTGTQVNGCLLYTSRCV